MQTANIYNRKQAQKPLCDWSYKKSQVTEVTGDVNRGFS